MSQPRSRIGVQQRVEPGLRITLLGPPDVQWTAPLTLPRRQTRALLYRLAASRQPVARDELGMLLAPHASQHAARRGVAVVLNQLRSALPCPELISVYNDSIGLDQQLIRTDLAAFEAGTGSAAAVELYRGPFLQGFVFGASAGWDDWVMQQRQHWERRYLDALAGLAEQLAARRDFTAAREAVQRYLAVDGLNEDMHRRLMALYAAGGDRAAALRQFERCVVTLERELGADPQPETRAMYEAIRGGHYALDGSSLGAPTVVHGHGALQTPSTIARQRCDTLPAAESSSALPGRPELPYRSVLPASITPLIGRDGDLDATAELLAANTRLLNLCGPGGAGKTRLALELAWKLGSSYRDGVVFVSLASLGSGALVAGAIVQALGLVPGRAVPSATLLQAFLADKQLLLVMDNLEHLPGAAPLLGELLAAAPELQILATSRTALKLPCEQLYSVLPLPLPPLACLPPPAELARQPAVALLVARAQQQAPLFRLSEDNAAELAAICVRLDGLPLAIELAAARLKLLSPRELLRRLDRRLDLLEGGPRDVPERRRSLRAAIAWSERLLDRGTQQCFAALAAFRGGWTTDAAAAVVGSPHNLPADLQALQQANLITVEAVPPYVQRYDMLETIRQYGCERLAGSVDSAAVQHKHAVYFVEFTEARAPRLHGSAAVDALHELDRDYGNIRAAFAWLIESGDIVLAARLAGALQWYWDTRGLLEEGRSWHALLRPLAARLPQPFGAHIQAQAAFLAYRQGDAVEAEQLAATVLGGARTAPADRVDALCTRGLLAVQRTDYTTAREQFEQALALATLAGSRLAVADAQANLGMLLLIQGRLSDAERYLQDSYKHFARLRHMRYMGSTLGALGYIAVLHGDVEQATAMLREAVENLRLVGEIPYLLYVLLAFGDLATLRGQPLLATMLRAAASSHAEMIGLRFLSGVVAPAPGAGRRSLDGGAAGALEQAEQQGRALDMAGALALALG